MMTRPLRTVAAALATTLVLAGTAVASAKAPTLYAKALSAGSKVTCAHTGITGPTGAVTGFAYALKGAHPAKAALSCARVIAVLKAGRADLFAKLESSYGKTLSVRGTRYTVRPYFGVAASGFMPAFVGGGSAVIAQYATGR